MGGKAAVFGFATKWRFVPHCVSSFDMRRRSEGRTKGEFAALAREAAFMRLRTFTLDCTQIAHLQWRQP